MAAPCVGCAIVAVIAAEGKPDAPRRRDERGKSGEANAAMDDPSGRNLRQAFTVFIPSSL
jgi:hypothetical protein